MAMAIRPRVLLGAPRLRIAEKHHDRVTDIFVDGRTVLERNIGHLGKIAVEQLVSSSLSVVSVKLTTSEKKMVSFFRLDAISTFCAPVKIEWVDLWRQIFR